MAESESGFATSYTVEEFVPERGATSVVWKWFDFKRSDVCQTIVMCKKCNKTVTTKGDNTTNICHYFKQMNPLSKTANECISQNADLFLEGTTDAQGQD